MRHFLLILIGLLITVSCQKDFYLEDLQNTQELLANSRASHRATSDALNAELETANAEIADLADQLTVVNAELLLSQEESAALQSDLEALQVIADDLQAQLDATQAELDDTLAQTEVDADVIANLTDQLEDLQAQYDDLVANPIIEIREVIRTVTNTVIQTNTVTNTVTIEVTAPVETLEEFNDVVSTLGGVEVNGDVITVTNSEGEFTFVIGVVSDTSEVNNNTAEVITTVAGSELTTGTGHFYANTQFENTQFVTVNGVVFGITPNEILFPDGFHAPLSSTFTAVDGIAWFFRNDDFTLTLITNLFSSYEEALAFLEPVWVDDNGDGIATLDELYAHAGYTGVSIVSQDGDDLILEVTNSPLRRIRSSRGSKGSRVRVLQV